MTLIHPTEMHAVAMNDVKLQRRTFQMECPVCFEASIPLIEVKPCAHAFCARCLQRLTELPTIDQRTRCPLCRTTFTTATNGEAPGSSPRLTYRTCRTSMVPAGVTFEQRGACRVRVQAMEQGDSGEMAGLRRGDVVVSMNDIAVASPHHAASILTTAHEHRQDVVVATLASSATRLLQMRSLWRLRKRTAASSARLV